MRAGVASGYCSVGDFGADERIEYTMIGTAVNLASRLEAFAAAGETWASQATRDLVGAQHSMRSGSVRSERSCGAGHGFSSACDVCGDHGRIG